MVKFNSITTATVSLGLIGVIALEDFENPVDSHRVVAVPRKQAERGID